MLVATRRRAAAAVRLFRDAERRDLRAGLAARVARAQRAGLRVHVRARPLLGRRATTGREHFATVEPFLVLFFVFYVAIAILYARRGRARGAGARSTACWCSACRWSAFALQAALVRDYRYGAAWSALALAARLRACSSRRCAGAPSPALALLARAFLALAVIFATLAIPLAFDDRWTAALWAIEAAGVYWIGVRQASPRRARLRAAGRSRRGRRVRLVRRRRPPTNRCSSTRYFIGAMLIALSGLATAFFADRAGADAARRASARVTPLVFGWGAVWWLAAGGIEIVASPRTGRGGARRARLGRRERRRSRWCSTRAWRWPRLAAVGVALLPVMAHRRARRFRARADDADDLRLAGLAGARGSRTGVRAARGRCARAGGGGAGRAPPGAGGFLRVRARGLRRSRSPRSWRGRRANGSGRVDARAHGVDGVRGGAARDRLPVDRHPVARRSRAGRSPIHGDAYAVGAGTPIAGAARRVVRRGQRALAGRRRRRCPTCRSPIRSTSRSRSRWRRRSDGRGASRGCRAQSLYGWLGVALVRRAQRRRAAHRAPVGRHPVAAAGAAGLEAAAGGADADLDARPRSR